MTDNPLGWLYSLLTVMVRASVAISLLPMFARQAVPFMARNAIVISTLLLVVMAQGPLGEQSSPGTGALAVMLLKEAALGLVLGLAFGMVFTLPQVIGEIIDHQTGLTFSQNADPINGNQTSVTASLIDRVFTGYFFAAGGFLIFIDTLYISYQLWPVMAAVPDVGRVVPELFTGETSRFLAFGLLLAAPVVLVLLLAEIGVGFLNRASPQLNIFNLNTIYKGWLGTFILMLALPFIVERTYEAVRLAAATLTQLMRGALGAG